MTATIDTPTAELGRARLRKEDAKLITGQTNWTDNIRLPGMLHLAFVRSPYAHAKITNVDVSGALGQPGVIAAFSAADFVVTKDNLHGGGQELNPVTRVFSGSTAGLAVNFAGETAGVVGLSYFFHKTGHHKMERYISMLNISSSAAAVTFDLAHR